MKLFLIFFFILSTYKVISVSDGDTITVLQGATQVKVRLNGIDCPEKGQDFGMVAKKFTSDFCFGKQVTLVTHGQDRYGRTIADVFVNGVSLNQELVRNGLAWHYKRFSNDTTLARLENEAREKKVGLWSGNPVAPWEFRKP